MVSPGGSLTGSFDQAVSWFSRLLTDHVYPEPDSETWKPKPGFAITLIHGDGVHRPSPRIVTYSRPSIAKPPKPFQSSRSGRGIATAAGGFAAGGRRGSAIGPASGRCARVSCSARVPRRLDSTARAAACITLR